MLKLNILIAIIVGLVIKILIDVEFIFKNVQEQGNFKDCKYLDLDIRGPEDLQFYKDNIIITGSANFGDLFYKGLPKLTQNTFYAIIDSDKKNFTTKKLSLIGFPSDVSLYIHGFDILKSKEGDFIYLVNHAYNHGGERIEILKIQENLDLLYINSIVMDKSLMGGLNDLIILNQTRIVVTRWLPDADHENGRGFNTIFQQLKVLVGQFLRLKRTYILDCQFSFNSKSIITPNCKKVAGSDTVMANGITWDHKDRIWFADSVLKKLTQFRLTNHELIYEKDIQFDYGLDNVEYDNKTDTLQLAFLGKLYEFLLLEHFNSKGSLQRDTDFSYWSGFGRYHLKNDSLEILSFSQNLSKGTSGGLLSGQNIFLGSWCDISVKVCTKH